MIPHMSARPTRAPSQMESYHQRPQKLLQGSHTPQLCVTFGLATPSLFGGNEWLGGTGMDKEASLLVEKKEQSGPDKRWVEETMAQSKIAARDKLIKAVPRLARKARGRVQRSPA